MAFLLVKALNRHIESILGHWFTGRQRPELKKYFIRKLERGIYLLEANGEILAHLWALKNIYKNELNIYAAVNIYDWQLPEEILKVSEWLEKEKRGRRPEKRGLVSKEELQRFSLNCSVSVKKS